ncbi:MAG TPA: hypothetical protein VD866_02550, partial [Urbifossiella sp.]|nr:hypothetical protein [Urbifossiella sp.]
MSRRTTPRLEQLEDRAMMAVISDSGGQLGSPAQYTVPIDPGLNLVRYQWQNYSIPDEFQIQSGGNRLVGDIGLQSNGHTGQTVFAGPVNSTPVPLTIKVTAPNQGTAWDFQVETSPVELKVDVKLGDVPKVNIPYLFKTATGFTLESVGLDPQTFQFVGTSNSKGKVADIDHWQDELKKGIFYYVPAVDGRPLNYGDTHTSDPGLGENVLLVRGQVNDSRRPELGTFTVEFPITFNVTDGRSSVFIEPDFIGPILGVYGAGTTKLDYYRQEQRLAYLGYPGGSNGNPIVVDGVIENNEWAKKAFSIALDPATPPTGRGTVATPTQGTKFFKDHINDSTAPSWKDLRTVPGLAFPAGGNQSQRFYSTSTGADLIAAAISAYGAADSTGAAQRNATGNPSVSHEGGRAIDIDTIPGAYFFRESGVYVAASAASGGGFIVRRANGTYRGGGNPNAQAGEVGLRTATLLADTTTTTINAVAGLLDYKQTEAEARR